MLFQILGTYCVSFSCSSTENKRMPSPLQRICFQYSKWDVLYFIMYFIVLQFTHLQYEILCQRWPQTLTKF